MIRKEANIQKALGTYNSWSHHICEEHLVMVDQATVTSKTEFGPGGWPKMSDYKEVTKCRQCGRIMEELNV